MTTAYVSFGANLTGRNPDLASILENVRFILSNFKEIDEIRVSRQYRTPAWPPGSGPDFLNAAMRFETSFGAEELLERLHQIEEQMGRVRKERWGPRVCDLDLLGLGDLIYPDLTEVRRWIEMNDEQAAGVRPDQLILPHPRFHRRAFVLLPLNDIAPDWQHPVQGHTVKDLVSNLDEQDLEGISVV